MDPTFIPTPDNIPVHWLWFHILLLVTFFIHVILMNLILGGSLLTLWDNFQKKSVNSEAGSIPTLIALTVNFGVPPLLFVQVLYGHLFYTSSILIAIPWILVIPVLILAYYGAYIFLSKRDKNPLLARISLITSSLILLYVAFVYVNNLTLSMTPGRFEMFFADRSGFRLNLGEPTLIPRYLHILTGSVAVAGLGRAAWYFFGNKEDVAKRESGIHSGLRIFAFATMIQVLVGILFWISLPKRIGSLFLGGNLLWTVILGLAILIAFLMITLAIRQKFIQSLIALLAVLSMMILIRDFVRRSYIEPVFSPADLTNLGKPSSLILFLGVFLIGLGCLYYMIRLILVKPKTELS